MKREDINFLKECIKKDEISWEDRQKCETILDVEELIHIATYAIDDEEQAREYAEKFLCAYSNIDKRNEVEKEVTERLKPKKPILAKGRFCMSYKCPNCDMVIQINKLKNCHVCGQVIDWSDVE